MSQLTNAIIRGAGNQIGRNLVNGRPRSTSRSSSSSRRGRPSISGFDKSLQFEIGGRASTMIGKSFNLAQEFEANLEENKFLMDSYGYFPKFAKQVNQIGEKINDVSSYLELIGAEEEYLNQINVISREVNNFIKEKMEEFYQLILNSDKDIILQKDNIVNNYLALNPYATIDHSKLNQNLESYNKRQREFERSEKTGKILGTVLFIAAFLGLMLFIWS